MDNDSCVLVSEIFTIVILTALVCRVNRKSIALPNMMISSERGHGFAFLFALQLAVAILFYVNRFVTSTPEWTDYKHWLIWLRQLVCTTFRRPKGIVGTGYTSLPWQWYITIRECQFSPTLSGETTFPSTAKSCSKLLFSCTKNCHCHFIFLVWIS